MRKIIKENWSRIKDLEKKVQEHTGDPEAGFNAGKYYFGKDYEAPILIPIKYRTERKKGSGNFSTSYKDMGVIITHCPFSGLPLYEEESEDTQN